MTEDELKLFSEFLEQKEFNSAAIAAEWLTNLERGRPVGTYNEYVSAVNNRVMSSKASSPQPTLINKTVNTPKLPNKSVTPSSVVVKNPNLALQGKVTNLRRLATTKNMVGKGALLAGATAATALTYNHFKKKRENRNNN